MKKKILFILPSLGTGGIVSSFNSLYNEINGMYDIRVLLASSNNNCGFNFSSRIIEDIFWSSYNYPFRHLSLFQKAVSLLLQPYKRLCIKRQVFPIFLAQLVSNRLERRFKFDFVVGFSEGLPTYLTSTYKSAYKLCWIHCDYKRYFEQRCRNSDELSFYSKMDRIILVSDYTRHRFLSIYPSLSPRTLCIYNLLDINHIIDASKYPIDDIRFNSDAFTLISVGRLDPVKRFTLIPQIAKVLKNQGVSFRWFIIGPDTEFNEAAVLTKGIVENGVEKEVVWLGSKKNPYSYMANSDLYVCLSSSEACPMVFNEAKILGLPILSTDFGSAKEFLKDGYNGYITDIDCVGNRILSLINNNERLINVRNNMKKDTYSNDVIIKSINSMFEELYN